MSDNKRLRMTITFPEYEKEVFEYIKNQKNSSALIRKLIITHMLSDGEVLNIENMATNRVDIKNLINSKMNDSNEEEINEVADEEVSSANEDDEVEVKEFKRTSLDKDKEDKNKKKLKNLNF